MTYDYLIVGAGFYGATFARLMTDVGKKCLVIDSRSHIGGNAYSEKREGIEIHVYGPHIFHTNDIELWNFINQFSQFNNFINSPKSFVNGRLYSLPFNMNTFYEIWGCTTPDQAKRIIEAQRFTGEPTNLEEQALSLVGSDIYNLLIRDYTIKQWKKDPKDLPAFIIKRLPLKFVFDNNYFNDRYQGIPVDGYTKIFENMLKGIECKLNTNYFDNKEHFNSIAKKIVFTGKIDEYFSYEFGELEYRTLEFQHEIHQVDNLQGNAVINYPSLDVPWTRMIEHKHFTKCESDVTVVTMEIPTKWSCDKVPYYPVNDTQNDQIYKRYRDKADMLQNVIFGGRLAKYQYMDMHQVIASAMKDVKLELHK